ncbi:MAG: hypothetical protein EOO37_05680, partial [Cytophagaceae bacterium]
MQEQVNIIRFGILCTSSYLAVWEDKALRGLLALAGTSLVVAIHLESPLADEKAVLSNGNFLWNNYLSWLYKPNATRLDANATPPPQVPVIHYSATGAAKDALSET